MRAAAVLLTALAGCAGGVDVDPTSPPEHLSDLGLFEYLGDGDFEYSEGVVPYDLNTALYSDHAVKDRAMWIPEGEAATYAPDAAFDFPVGTVLMKSFSFPADLRDPSVDRRLVETRVLIRSEEGWEGWPYVWDEDESDAVLTVGGKVEPIALIDESGEALSFSYMIPQKNQCTACHELKDDAGERSITPIGPKARHLERTHVYDGEEVGQLQYLAMLGMLEGLPDEVPAAYDFRDVLDRGVAALTPEETEAAARDWLDVNCAHCHNPRGVNGITSQLFLNHDQADPFHLGVCKVPGSAGTGGTGRTWDVVPGDHEASILWHRMTTTDVGAMMPLLGRSTTYDPASELIGRWIDEMEGEPCAE